MQALEPNIKVMEPISAIKANTLGEYSKRGEHLIIKKTPAVTIVAACIRADTGVGPSIASGSHMCNPTCADLLIAAMNKNKHIKSKKFTEELSKLTPT
jgi:hypothetical protein